MSLPGAKRTSHALTCASLALAGCEASTPDADASPAMYSVEESWAGIAGTYETTLSDGTVIVQTIMADGTYRETNADGATTETGRWRQNGAELCFDPQGEPPETCYAGGAAGDSGLFEIRDANGEVSTRVRRVTETQARSD